MMYGMRRLVTAPLLATLFSALAVSGASAATVSSSPLPGYPRFGGVMLVHDGSPATAAEEKAIASALKQQASVSAAGVSESSTSPDCLEAGINAGADLCWWGGPVVRAHSVHLIFWEGLAKEHPFPHGYVEAVEGYFAHVAASSGSATNVYAVGAQYGDQSGPGEYKVKFAGAPDVYNDIVNGLPASGSTATACEDRATEGEPCVTDKDLQEEIERARVAKGLEGGSWLATLSDIYFVFTPPKVGSCFYDHQEEASKGGNICAFASGGYCGYHSDFESAGEPVPPLYANMPDSGNMTGCDSGEHPNSASGVDATLDVVSHEHNETITDPLVSTGWTDVIGQEIGDKCLPPETFDVYGDPFNTEAGALYNQIVGSGHYFLQREWSNSAFSGEGGCVQRMLPTSFTPPSEPKATAPSVFDGSSSGEPGDSAVYWVWSFGDGMQAGTSEANASHTYAKPGTYKVTLTAFDGYGNSNTHSTTVEVGAAPPPPPPTPAPEPITLTKTVTVLVPQVVEPTAYTASQLASKLGLPANGATLAGLGPIAIGHAECPPACTIAVRLYAVKHVTVHGHRFVKRTFVGALTTTLGAKRSRALTLTLNATGRKLLRRSRTLPAALVLSVTGKEGGSWQITRALTLTSSGKAARRGRG